MFSLGSPFEEDHAALSSELSRVPAESTKSPSIAGTVIKPDFSIDIPEGSQTSHEKFLNLPDVFKAILTGAGTALTGGLSVAAGAGIAALTFSDEKQRDEEVDEALGQTVRGNAANTEIELQGKYKLNKLGIDAAKMSMGSSTVFGMLQAAARAGKDSYEVFQSSLPPGPDFNMYRQYPFEAAKMADLGSAATRNSIATMRLMIQNGVPGWGAFMEAFKESNPGLQKYDYDEIEVAAQRIPSDVYQKMAENNMSIPNIHRFMMYNAARRVTDPAGADADLDAFRNADFKGSADDWFAKFMLMTRAGLDAGTLVEETPGIVTNDEMTDAETAAHKRADMRAKIQGIDTWTSSQRDELTARYYQEGMIEFYNANGGYDTVAIQATIDTYQITAAKLQQDPYLISRVEDRIIRAGMMTGLSRESIEQAIAGYNPDGTPKDNRPEARAIAVLQMTLAELENVTRMRKTVTKAK